MPGGFCAVCGGPGASEVTDEGFVIHPGCRANLQIDPASRTVEERQYENCKRQRLSRRCGSVVKYFGPSLLNGPFG